MGFVSKTEETMYNSFFKKVHLTEKNGIQHKAKVINFQFGDDDEREISSIALNDGTWIYEDQIESIEIMDDEE